MCGSVIDKCYFAGIEAFDKGFSVQDCPYKSYGAKRDAWLEGFNYKENEEDE